MKSSNVQKPHGVQKTWGAPLQHQGSYGRACALYACAFVCVCAITSKTMEEPEQLGWGTCTCTVCARGWVVGWGYTSPVHHTHTLPDWFWWAKCLHCMQSCYVCGAVGHYNQAGWYYRAGGVCVGYGHCMLQ